MCKRSMFAIGFWLLACVWVNAQATQKNQPDPTTSKQESIEPKQTVQSSQTGPADQIAQPKRSIPTNQGSQSDQYPLDPTDGLERPNLPIQGDQTQISGIVTDSSGAVVSGASVEATNKDTHQVFSTRSGADGNFTLEVPVGHYSIRYSMGGFKSGTTETDAQIGASTFVDLKLNVYGPEQNGQIRVHVDDAQGHGKSAIQVRVTSNNGDEHEGSTNDQGDYVQGGLGGGTYRIVATAGRNPCKKINIDDGQSKSVTLKLSETCQ